MANVVYFKYKIQIDPESEKLQGLRVGDVVRRQYSTGGKVIYTLMVVMETGEDTVDDKKSPWFIGAHLEGDVPKQGELLDFVRTTNLFDADRSGAMYLTSSDDGSPYMDVIDGMAVDNSLCYPVAVGKETEYGDPSKYNTSGAACVGKSLYKEEENGVRRIHHITRSGVKLNPNQIFGFLQRMKECPANPERIVISFKIRAEKEFTSVPIFFGIASTGQKDASQYINIGTDWKYHLWVLTLSNPEHYERDFIIDLTNHFKTGNWCEMAELNIVPLSDISVYAAATKARVGKVSGIVDPVFGTLEGYGAYFQHLYATKNVNIAGTLTAGDENGFASTFYVGKIHKNVIPNSTVGEFSDPHTYVEAGMDSPIGIGSVWKLGTYCLLRAQSAEWRTSHLGKRYCLSFWAFTDEPVVLSIYQDEHYISNVILSPSYGWRRHHISFTVKASENSDLVIRLDCTTAGTLLSAPQLEAGIHPSQYQPTDGKLSYVEDYGAWFSKGGIGGTIQNPLLRLESDGSIRARDDSFVINIDGTGHFGSGRFRWTKDSIYLQDYVIRWEDLDEDAREHMKGDKGDKGDKGNPGIDANLLDWVKEWDTNKTQIGSTYVITPKIFAGVKNSDGTITGTAIGRFSLQTRNASGNIISETVDGIYGFRAGLRTFSLDNTGSVELGRGDQSIRYDAATGKILFGKEVSLNWQGDIDKAVSSIQVGVRNYIKYSTFVQDKVGDILTVDGVTAVIDSTTKYEGYNTIKVTQTTATNSNAGANRIFFNSTKLCNPASFSLWVKSNVATDLIVRIGGNGVAEKFAISPTWHLIKLENRSPNSNVVVIGATKAGAVFNIALPMLVEGSKVVDWSPSPDDLQYDVTLARKVAEDLVKQSQDEQWSKKLTYIDNTGIFTGTLSANTVNAIRINASQITAGIISADRIDVASLKAQLITAGNIEALTLNVVRGKIGGWSLDADSIYRGTKNNTTGAFTAASGSITIGSNGIRGFKWILDSTGAGKLAGGNISWDAAGNVTFGASVVLSWNTPINEIKTALGGNNYPKLTHISSTGIYTGTLTATQVNAVSIDAGSIKTGTLSADRIAAGSIKADKLDAASIKTSIINTDYINGLTLNFVRGKIGGWTIGSDAINGGALGTGNTFIQLRTAATGTGYVYNGAYKPMGLTLSWHQSSNAGHLVFGSINATGNTQRAGFIGLQMLSWDHQEYFCISANATKSGGKEIYNRIAGWAFDHQTISKGNVSLGADGTISNGTKWKLANDGSGSIASGNISWDTAGNVTFASSIKVQWQKDIDAALKDVDVDLEPARELALAMAYGKMLYRDPTFYNGVNSIKVYNNSGNGTVTHTRAVDSNAPNDSKYVIVIRNAGTSSPNCGGFYFGTTSSYRKVYITRIIAKIPVGRNIAFASNTAGTGYSQKWLTPIAGTGDWCEYISKVVCGISGSFGATNYFTITGAVGTTASPVEWRLAYATVFDTTSAEKLTTTIDANGIYTGTLTATQVNAVSIDAASIKTGFLAVERIAAGSIKAEKLDVANLRASIVTADHINSLTLNVVRGKIGGWNIGADYIYQGVQTAGSGTAIQIRTASTGSGAIYSGAYKPYGITLTWHMGSNAGHLVMGQVMTNTSTPRAGFHGLQMMNHSGHEFFCMAVNTSLSGSTAYYNRIAGWIFDHQKITKGNVSLGADGSITNGTKWKLNNDGSGSVASGNISWNASGTVSFASSVSLNWTTPINSITNALGGSSYPKLTKISATGIYTGTINANQITINSSLIVGGSTTATTYNGSIIVRNTSNSNVVVLDRTGITATGGKIAGWTIDADSIYRGTKMNTATQFTSGSGSVTIGSNGIRGYRWNLDANGAGRLAGGNISWTAAGALTMKDAIIENVWIKGNIRNAFVKYDSSIWVTIGGGSSTQKPDAEKYDNLCTFGGSDSGGWTLANPTIPWTVDQSGRRLTLVHYRYGSEYAYGTQTITAPSGKYFYENGLTASKLTMSREVVELLGLGTPSLFHGWIVLNRKDIGTTSKYGSEMKMLAMGTVTWVSNTSARIKYRTYDGSTMSVTKPNTKGLFYVYLPWSLGADKYMVMLSGIWGTQDNTPIYATIKTQGSSYFYVQTQDDASGNNGSFNFVVISAADFK